MIDDSMLYYRHCNKWEAIGKVKDLSITTPEWFTTSASFSLYDVDKDLLKKVGNMEMSFDFGFDVCLTTKIKRVIFSPPATIVFWSDNTKTVVKCHEEDFDPEKGLAMAICKRVYGSKFHKVFKDHLPEDPRPMLNDISKQINDLAKELK